MKRKTIGIVIMALCAAIVAASGGGQNMKDGFQIIDTAEAKKRMETNPDVVIVDVRTQEEYTGGHIPGAILIPLDTISGKRPAQLPDTDAEILVYCRSGSRSRIAAKRLAALGYTNVYDFGGIIDWRYDVNYGNSL